MKLKLDAEKFEELQTIFITDIIERVRVKLYEEGLDARQIENLTAGIAFSIASVIDDTSGVQSDGVEARPYLTFRGDDDEIIHCGENAYTYEFVMDVLKKLFPG